MPPRSSASARHQPIGAAETDEAPVPPQAAGSPAWPTRPALAYVADRTSELAGSPLAEAGPGTDSPDRSEQTPGRSHMTARGAMLAMFGLFLGCDLVASWTGHEVVAGLGFAAACLLGPYFVRKHALLQVVAAPPAVFLIALVITQIGTAQGTGKHGKILSVLEGTVLVLAAIAPWLLSGAVLGVAVAIPRGLVQCARDLKRELREDLALRQPWTRRSRG